MAPNGFRQLQLNFSGMGCWLTLAIGFVLLTTVGLGWLLKSLLVIIAILFFIPIALIIVAQIWIKRNLVEGACPSCSQPLTGFKPIQLSCPNCGVALQAREGVFTRVTPEGTIDVDVVDVESSGSSSAENVTVVDVEVLPPADQ